MAMSRAEIWAMMAALSSFAFAKVGEVTIAKAGDPADSAASADGLMKEFDKRFIWHETSTGGAWVERTNEG